MRQRTPERSAQGSAVWHQACEHRISENQRNGGCPEVLGRAPPPPLCLWGVSVGVTGPLLHTHTTKHTRHAGT
jgi:hypothetical protein